MNAVIDFQGKAKCDFLQQQEEDPIISQLEKQEAYSSPSKIYKIKNK